MNKHIATNKETAVSSTEQSKSPSDQQYAAESTPSATQATLTAQQRKLVEQLENELPQTQCTLCSHPGCAPYATAIATQQAPLDRCLPGGVPVMRRLAAILKQDVAHLEEDLAHRARPAMRAVIREEHCIGCTKCISACPVDAIIGTAKHMHRILQDDCTGCELCIAPCPVDCIDMVLIEHQQPSLAQQRARAQRSKKQYIQRQARLQRQQQQRLEKHRRAKQARQAAAETTLATLKDRKPKQSATAMAVCDTTSTTRQQTVAQRQQFIARAMEKAKLKAQAKAKTEANRAT